MTLNVSIEHLVLHDINIDPSQADVLKNAVESEIARQLSIHRQSLSFSEGADTYIRSAQGNSISIHDSPNIEILGKQIGKAVFKGIQQ